MPLPVVGHLLEGQGSTPLSKETTINEGQTDLNAQIADYQALIDRKLVSTMEAWKDNYMRLNAELFRDTKLIDQKRENRPTRKTAADDVQLWFGYTFLARKEDEETYVEYGNLFTFLDSIYATLRKDDLRSLLEDGKVFGYFIKINEAQRACLEAYYDLWQ